MSLLLLFRAGRTIQALTGVAFGQGVGAARLAVLRRMAGAAYWPGNRHRAAGARPPGGWPGCWRRDRLRRAPGGPRPARDRGGLRYGGRAPGGRPEAGRELPQDRPPLAHSWPVCARWLARRPVRPPSSGARPACARWRVWPLAGRASSASCCRRSGRQPAARCASGGRRGPCRSALEDRSPLVRREARVLVPAAEDRTIHPRTKTGASTHDVHQRPGCGPRLFGGLVALAGGRPDLHERVDLGGGRDSSRRSTDTITTTKATVWLRGGAGGITYLVTNRIVTVGGRTDDRTISVKVEDR